MYSLDILYVILTILSDDSFTTVAERSKALDLSSSLVRDVGSNPTGSSIFFLLKILCLRQRVDLSLRYSINTNIIL